MPLPTNRPSWLGEDFLDHNAPMGLARHLRQYKVKHTSELGWGGISNGSLLALAEANGFTLLITGDKNISYQNAVEGGPLGILALSTNNWRVMQPYLTAIIDAVETAQPGEVKAVSCGKFVPRKHRK